MKKVKIVFNILIIILILTLTFFVFWNPKQYLVFVENQEIYDELFSVFEKEFGKNPQKSPFYLTNQVKPKIEDKSFNRLIQNLFQPSSEIVANISLAKDFPFNPVEKLKNQKVYKIGEKNFIPSVEMNFTSSKSDDYVKLPPDFSVSISEIDKIPENHRGVKVENQYVTEEGYKFRENTYLVCSFFDENSRDEIQNFLEKAFSDTNCNITLVEKSENSTPLFIAGVGDMMVGRGVQEILIYYKDGLARVFADTLPILQGADLTLGNLEGAITYHNEILPKTYNFKFDKKVLSPLKNAGFDYLMINNNHVFDYGQKGFLDSINALKEAGIATSGVGKNYEEASKFYITKVKNQNVAIISVGAYPKERSGFDGANVAATGENPGVLWKNDKIFQSVKELKNQGMLIIASVHDGDEYGFKTNEAQKDFAEKLIDSGVSLVLESHAHVLQPIQRYKDGIIAYGLGNFVFPGMEEIPGATESLVLRVGFVDGKPIYVEPYPCEIDGTQVRGK